MRGTTHDVRPFQGRVIVSQRVPGAALVTLGDIALPPATPCQPFGLEGNAPHSGHTAPAPPRRPVRS